MTKFKVGDRVRLVNNSVLSALNLGWEGTVVEVRGYEDEYYVLFDEQDKDWSETDQPGAACSGHEIELVEEKKNISFRQLGFKVGDRVRCVSLIGDWGPCGDGPYYPGDEFTLVENRAGEPVIYASDGGLPWYGDAGSWELVTETKQEETNVETAQFYPYSVTDTNISVFVAGRQHVIPAGTKNFDDLKEHLKTGKHDYDTIMSLVDRKTAVEKYSGDTIKIVGSTVFYKGVVSHNAIAEKLVRLVSQGFDVAPWMAFMEKVMENPNEDSKQSLYTFLEHFNTPITQDGDFLAFKRVRDDFMDIHSGTFDNSPGKIVEMPREEVDSDVNQTCSRGLHACADSYLGEFYAKSSGYKVIVVKINPKDVCAVPADYNFSKMRTCRYEVLSEAEEETVREIAQSEFSTFGQRAYEAAPEAPEVTGPLQVGDRVKLSKHGISQYVSPHWPNPRNPENVVGTLFEDPEPIMGFVWTVDWDNGSSNNYREEDLELVDRPSAGMDDYAESWGGFPDEDYYSSYEPDYYNSYDDYR